MVQNGRTAWARRTGGAALLLAAAAVLVLLAPARAAASPLAWAAPAKVSTVRLAGVSCASPTLCVALDAPAGDVIGSALPNGGAAAWTVSPLKGLDNAVGVSCVLGGLGEKLCAAVDCAPQAWTSADPLGGAGAWGGVALEGFGGCGLGELPSAISCPTVTECVGVASHGSYFYTGAPRGPGSGWKVESLDATTPINAISCPSPSLCVAVDNHGRVLASSTPTAGASAWSVADVDGSVPIMSVSCTPAPTLCAAGDEAGNVLVSTNPLGGAGAWTAANVDGTHGLLGLSCASASLCVGVDNGGGAVVSTAPTAGAAAWSREQVATYVIGSVSCPSASLCVAADWKGNVIVGTGTGTAPPPPPTPGEKSKGTPGTPETRVFVPPALLAGVESGPEGQTTVSLACPAGGASCGTITAQLTVRFSVKGRTITGVLAARRPPKAVKTVLVASGSLRLAAGARAKLKLNLNSSGRAALRRFGRMTARLRILGPSGLQATRTVKLAKVKPPARRRR